MSRYIDKDALIENFGKLTVELWLDSVEEAEIVSLIGNAPSIDIVRCENCRKSHIDGKTTHYLWCTEWGRSTDTFGYCERADRKERVMTNEEAKAFLDNLKICIEEHPVVADWLVEIADRKTENSSEIPNNSKERSRE